MNKHLVILLLSAGLLVPSMASAKINKQLRAEAEGYLAEMAEETDSEALQAAMLSEAQLQGKKASKKLTPSLSSEDRPVRFGAALALASTGDKKAVNRLVKELVAEGKLLKTLEERVSVLNDKVEVKVYEGIFKESQPPANAAVVRYLATKDGVLGKLYLKTLTGKDAGLRKLATDSAVYWRNAEMLKPAEKLAKSKDDKARNDALRIAIAISLRDSTRTASIGLLTKLAKDKAPAIAEKAAKRLVDLQNPAGTAALLKLIKAETKASKRTDLMQFLLERDTKVGFKDVEAYLGAEDSDEKIVAHRLAARSKNDDFLKKLLKLEKSIEFDDRILAIRALGYTKSNKAGEVLSRTLFEGRIDVRLETAASLEALGSATTLPGLTRALKGERDTKVKIAVIKALGAIKSKKSVAALRYMVTNNNLEIKTATVTSIRRIGLPDGAKALQVLFKDRNREVQWLAFMTAMELDSKKGMKQLANQIRNPTADYIEELTSLKGKTRTAVIEYLLTKAGGSAQSDIIRWAMIDGTWDKHLRTILTQPSTASGDQRALMIYFADNHDRKGMMAVERQVRSAQAKQLKRLAIWLMAREPKKDLEPSFRGLIGSKDPAIRAVAIYGLLSIHK